MKQVEPRTACDAATAAGFLAGSLTEEEEAAFVAHLDECACCRERLEREAGDAAGWENARALLAAPPAPSQDSSDELPADLRFLAPTDDARGLGRIGGYEVTGLIGRGGMGAVFRALDPPLGRTVAVKVIDPALAADPATRARFAREARAMAAVSHPHVVPVYAVDEHRVPASSDEQAEPTRTLPYFVMEYVPGETLAGRLARSGPLSVVAAVRVARQIALGLAAAHAQGLIHRDVKPANVLLERGVERVRVADFGLARPAANDERTSLTHTGQTAGTPEYMAPEQVRGEPCDARADLFALGATLYAALAGHGPFRGGSLYDVLRRVVEEDPPDLRAANPAVPVWLAAFCETLLAKTPADRFPSAENVVARLAGELAHLENPRTPAPIRDYLPAPVRWRRIAGSLAAAGVCVVGALVAMPDRVEPQPAVQPLPTQSSPVTRRPRGASALPGEITDDAWDADLRTAHDAAERLERPPPLVPPAADTWRSEFDAANAAADRLLREFPP